MRTSAEGRTSRSRIDDLGRTIEVTFGNLEPTRFVHDDLGLLTSIRSGAGEDERVVEFGYDALGRLEKATDPLGDTVGLSYGAADRLQSLSLRDGRKVDVTFNSNVQLTSLTPPGRLSHAFGYTMTGMLRSYDPPALDQSATGTRWKYNLDRQLASILTADGSSVEMAYDAAGRLATIMLPSGQLSYAFSPETGSITGATSPYGIQLGYEYDSFLLTKVTWAGAVAGTVERTYDEDLRLASRTVNEEQPVTFDYDEDGLLIRAGRLSIEYRPDVALATKTALDHLTTNHDYNAFGEPVSIEALFGQSQLLGLVWELDKRGRIVHQTESLAGEVTEIDHRYDDAGRLETVLRDGEPVEEYAYDSNGNRTVETDASGITTLATYDDQDRLLTYGATLHEYSDAGTLLTKTRGSQSVRYSYDVLGNLLSVLLPDGVLIEYVHDARGRRVGKRVDGVLVSGLLYKDWLKPIAELDGDGNLLSRFVYGTRPTVPAYMSKAGVTYRIVADHLGSPRLIVDAATGEVVQELRYDAFGRVVLDTNPGFQPFGFAGGLYDYQTGLVRFGFRDYDPEVGRWTAKDPLLFLGGSTSLYVYADNDPVNLIDPDGRDVINRCDCTIFVKPGDGDEAIPLGPNETYDAPPDDKQYQDGIAIPSRPGEVFKTVDGIDVTVSPDGDVDTEVADYVGGTRERIRRGAGQLLKGRWKDLDWLRDVHKEKPPHDHGWDALFNAVDPDGGTGCPLELP